MRRIAGFVASTLVLVASIALATPALAANATAVCTSNGTTSANVALGGTYDIAVGTGCVNFTWTYNRPTYSSGGAVTILPANAPATLEAMTAVVAGTDTLRVTNPTSTQTEVRVYLYDAGSLIQQFNILFSSSGGGGGGGGGSSSSTSAAAAPALETLTLQVSTGNTTCTGGSPTGYSGSWLQLPAADACSQSGPNANPNAKLLGWATDPLFPVSVAQEIVDLKYGPIDAVIDGTRMIFIPAGGWTFVSGSNNLFPIWSS